MLATVMASACPEVVLTSRNIELGRREGVALSMQAALNFVGHRTICGL